VILDAAVLAGRVHDAEQLLDGGAQRRRAAGDTCLSVARLSSRSANAWILGTADLPFFFPTEAASADAVVVANGTRIGASS